MYRLGSIIALASGATGLIYSGLVRHTPEKQSTDHFGPALAKAYVALFNDMDLVKQGMLGVARDPLANSHLREENQPKHAAQIQVQRLIDEVKGAGFELEEGLFAIQGQKSKTQHSLNAQFPSEYRTSWRSAEHLKRSGMLFGPKSWIARTADGDLEKFAKEIYHQAAKKPYTSERAGYNLYSFPIKFEHKECLSCHASAKLHDTAAVLTLAFKKA